MYTVYIVNWAITMYPPPENQYHTDGITSWLPGKMTFSCGPTPVVAKVSFNQTIYSPLYFSVLSEAEVATTGVVLFYGGWSPFEVSGQ